MSHVLDVESITLSKAFQLKDKPKKEKPAVKPSPPAEKAVKKGGNK